MRFFHPHEKIHFAFFCVLVIQWNKQTKKQKNKQTDQIIFF